MLNQNIIYINFILYLILISIKNSCKQNKDLFIEKFGWYMSKCLILRETSKYLIASCY
jgi:hypothetical protein